MSQKKEQDKTPEEQLSEWKQAMYQYWKRIQSNDSEEDPRFWKKEWRHR